jgi:hypothetical protein
MEDDIEPDKSLRVVEFMKSNYGPVADAITMRWKDGVFIPEPKSGSLEKLASEAKADDVLLGILKASTVKGAPSAKSRPFICASTIQPGTGGEGGWAE